MFHTDPREFESVEQQDAREAYEDRMIDAYQWKLQDEEEDYDDPRV